MSVRIVLVAIFEYHPNIFGKGLRTFISTGVHVGLDRSKIHRLGDDNVVIVKVQRLGINWFVEGPSVGPMLFVS